jgi:four helix bundle protein
MATPITSRGLDIRDRSKLLGVQVIGLFQRLQCHPTARILASQFLRAGTAIGANYRAACRARSRREFIAKLGIVVEETDETLYWLDLFVSSNLAAEADLALIRKEAEELLRIFVASIATARKGLRRR